MKRLQGAAVLACVAWLAACDAGPEERAEAACTVICRCFEVPLPNNQQECIAECVTEIDFISEACAQCITRNANQCSSLEFECEPLCDPGVDDPGDPPMPLPDAGGF